MSAGFIKSYNVQVNDIISQTGTTPAANLSLLLASKRGNDNAPTPLTLAPISVPLYEPYEVDPTYTASGSTFLSWAKSIGATVVTGTSGTITLTAPSTVTLLQGGTYVQLNWDAEPYGWSSLLGGGVSGSLTQLTSLATGSLYTVSQSLYSLTLSAITGVFDTTHAVTIAYTNASNPLPNGELTEQWVLDGYYACQAFNLNNTLNLTFGKPSLTLSLVSDRDANYSANPASVSLGTPSSVSTTGLPSGQVILIWNTAPANWIYVPQSAFGTTVFSQSTGTITGTLIEQLGAEYTPNGTGVAVLLGDVSGGSFTTATTSMVLDSTVSTFSLLGNTWYQVVSTGYEITSASDFNTTNADFVDYITSVNTQQATANGQFGTLGVFAQSSTLPANYLGNVQPNNPNFICAFYYYPNLSQDTFISAGQISAAYAAVTASNSLPYNTTYGVVINGLPVSSNSQTYVTTGISSEAENLLQYGYSPIAVNQSSGQAYMYMPVTTQTSIDGVTDQEFYDVRTQQVRATINQRLDEAMKAQPFQNGQINDKLIEQAKAAIYNTLLQAQTDNLIFNVPNWKNSIVVTRSTGNAHQLNISCVIQISPSLTSILITVNVVSSLITPPNTQA